MNNCAGTFWTTPVAKKRSARAAPHAFGMSQARLLSGIRAADAKLLPRQSGRVRESLSKHLIHALT